MTSGDFDSNGTFYRRMVLNPFFKTLLSKIKGLLLTALYTEMAVQMGAYPVNPRTVQNFICMYIKSFRIKVTD